MNLSLTGMRIGLLTASASRLGGGVAEAVMIQAAMIRQLGGTAVIFALADEFAEADRARYAPSELRLHSPRGPAQIGYAPGLVQSLLAARLDLLHLHGIWMYPSRAGSRWARATGRGYIVSPHGMLDRWITARGRWKRALARIGYERASWQAASFLHALTASEAGDITRESGRNDSVVIANAAPAVPPLQPGTRPSQISYIGRIHHKKNLVALVTAWQQAGRPPGSSLTIAGWGDAGHIAGLEAVLASGDGSARFVGPVYGAAKQDLLEQSRFVILPSLSEGLPMAVLEGWAAGTPTIMTDACNLPEGFHAKAALQCGTSAAEIAVALENALRLGGGEWADMSGNARALAAGPFSADAVARQWSGAYLRAIAPEGEPVR